MAVDSERIDLVQKYIPKPPMVDNRLRLSKVPTYQFPVRVLVRASR
jgi:hypothetical protein